MTQSIGVIACALLAGSACGQQVFNAGTLNAIQSTRGLSLGPATAGATSYLITTNWSTPSGGFSIDAEFALAQNAAPAAAGTTYRPMGRFNNGQSNGGPLQLFAYGSLAAPIAAGQNVAINYRQNFSGATGTFANTRVVLNPIINAVTTRTGLSVPASFTDLGKFDVGQTSLTLPVSGGTRQWFRFQVDGAVSNSLGNALDIFTTGSFDSRLVLFRQTAIGLLPVANTDDIASGSNLNAALSFGSANPASNGRGTYAQPGATNFFAGQGGTEAAPVGFDAGYFAGPAGAASLSSTEVYWLGLQNWNGVLSSSGPAPTATLGSDGVSVNITDTRTLTWASTTTSISATTLNIRSIPSPGAAGVVLVAGVFATRRRRR